MAEEGTPAATLGARIAADVADGGRFRVLPERVPIDDTRQETRVDDDEDHEDTRSKWTAILYAIDDA
jgi:hypothetical protein